MQKNYLKAFPHLDKCSKSVPTDRKFSKGIPTDRQIFFSLRMQNLTDTMRKVHGWNETLPFMSVASHKCSDTLLYVREFLKP
jgi:hypothetical protein